MAVQAGSTRCLELLLTWDVQDPGSGQTGRREGRDTGERAAHVQQAVCHMVDQDGQTLAHMAAAQHNPVIISTSFFVKIKLCVIQVCELSCYALLHVAFPQNIKHYYY